MSTCEIVDKRKSWFSSRTRLFDEEGEDAGDWSRCLNL